MEENKNPAVNSIENRENIQPPQNPTPQNEKPKDGKFFKIFIATLVVLGLIFIILSYIVAPFLLEKIDPISKLNEAHIKACTSECSSSKDSKCINKCLESKGYAARVTEARSIPSLTPLLTPTSSPTPTLTPVPTTVTKKVTSVPKSSPTPAGNPTLVIRVSKGVSSVTLANQTTGKTTTDSISAPGKNYYVEPGAYRITFNEVPNCRAAYSLCYENCSLTSGHWGQDDWGTMANVNVEAGKTHAVSLYYADPSKPVEICKTL